MTDSPPDAASFGRSSETVRNGFATPHRLTSLPGKLSGCLYRSDGTKVALSERFGGYMGDYAVSDNPETIPPPVAIHELPGRGLYLGHHMGGHYGHFITEGLSSFWIFEDHPAKNFDYFLLHPFTFGDRFPEYARYCLRTFGIDEDRIVLVESEPVGFNEILVPERLFRLNHSADPRLRWVYQQITRDLPPPGGGSRLYVSRRRVSRSILERVVANEVTIERTFEAHGFEVLYPETMEFEEQIARYHRAEIVAGISGSGLHNSVFMHQDAELIELGDPRYEGKPAPTQALCNSISGVSSTFIPFTGRSFGVKQTMLFDIPFLRTSLERLDLDSSPDRTPTSRRRGPWPSVLAILEIAYLSVRPSAGRLARDLLGRMFTRWPRRRAAGSAG